MEHYLDNAATTVVAPECAQAALNCMINEYGNPSSTHTKGRAAKKILEDSRRIIAGTLGCVPGELFFTSCGSESDNWAILCGAESKKRQGKHIISSPIEHDAVRKPLARLESLGWEVTYLKPDSTGVIPPESVKQALRPDTALVSLMLVNNETGAVNDIAAIRNVLCEAGSSALLHTDAVQAFLKVPFQAKTLGADLISLSGHKIHAIKGVGALYIRKGVKLKPFLLGGEQESGLRAGTEALPQIASFAAACALGSKAENMAQLKSYLIEALTRELPNLTYLPTAAPHILSISLPGYRSEVLMNYLEAQEIYVSKSSACKQGKRSHVLTELGMSPSEIDGALRIGLSRYSTREDADALVGALKTACSVLSHR